ncbi:MAG: hypothetical protein RL446_630 [Pseudomonadota bacterium]|jgi:periplasmic divalent cation tolerance protein
MDRLVVALCSVPDRGTADALSSSVLKARLAACVSQIPGVRSQYWWQGSLESTEEIVLMIKTTSAQVDQLKSHVQENHPYETPELLFIPVESALDGYAQWVRAEVR